MRTIELKVYVDEALHELLIAELADLAFESFVEGENHILAYIRARDWNDVAREGVERWLRFHGLPVEMEERIYEPENWNQRWEETVKPVVLDRFVIKPTWADIPPDADGRILLEIDPKMSFGTGYHESTRLALRLLPDHMRPGINVLDAGTGTGVLAIAAARLGAAHVYAFDTDEWSYTNALENVFLNQVSDRVTVASGSLESVPVQQFALILANINRAVLVDMMSAFGQYLTPDGRIILAGVLESDRDLMIRNATHQGFESAQEATEGAWWAVVLKRATD